jgi:hypothetical protein
MRNPAHELPFDLRNEAGLISIGSKPGSQTTKAPRHHLCCLKTPDFLHEFRYAQVHVLNENKCEPSEILKLGSPASSPSYPCCWSDPELR